MKLELFTIIYSQYYYIKSGQYYYIKSGPIDWGLLTASVTVLQRRTNVGSEKQANGQMPKGIASGI